MLQTKIADFLYEEFSTQDRRGCVAVHGRIAQAREMLARAKREAKAETGRTPAAGSCLIAYPRKHGVAVYFRGCPCAECKEAETLLTEFLGKAF